MGLAHPKPNPNPTPDPDPNPNPNPNQVTERRYQLILAVLLPREISPGLAKRTPADILDEIDLTRALAAKMKSGAFSM